MGNHRFFLMKILVTGSDGLLSSALKSNSCFTQAIFLSHKQLDITNTQDFIKTVNNVRPEIVINSAAYTNVTKAENEKDIANKVNGFCLSDISKVCTDRNIWLIHFSTDYVFNGKKDQEYTEEDITCPVNAYGYSKLIGEENILKHCQNYTIIRVSWLYGLNGSNFFSSVHKWLTIRSHLQIVDDQFGKTTYSSNVADATISIILNNLKGVYHYSNDGCCSRYEYAKYIKNLIKSNCEITPVPSDYFPDPTPRPEKTFLNTSKFKKDTKKQIPYWQDSVKHYVNQLGIL